MTPDTFPVLFYAYSIIWTLLVIYIVLLGLRVSALRKQVTRLEGRDVRSSRS